MQIDDSIQQTIDSLYEHLNHPDLEVETKKIMQKLREAKYNKGDVIPFADCILAIFLAAKNAGFSVQSVCSEVNKLAEKIKGRTWKRMPDGTYQSVV